MKIFKFNKKIIGQIIFVIIILFTSPVKSLDKFNKADRFLTIFQEYYLLMKINMKSLLIFLKN